MRTEDHAAIWADIYFRGIAFGSDDSDTLSRWLRLGDVASGYWALSFK